MLQAVNVSRVNRMSCQSLKKKSHQEELDDDKDLKVKGPFDESGREDGALGHARIRSSS